MSRRQSRLSVDTRQSDTLVEFETFKKKFLLANKHITKLNSTLSVRIEELNAQISTLHVENLRLRASEIALASQLKREREKSRKIIADAEAATQNLMKHLGLIRKSFNIAQQPYTTPEQPPAPRARRPVSTINVSPGVYRLARPPGVPGIIEDDETSLSGNHDGHGFAGEDALTPTPHRRKSKSRPSSSRQAVAEEVPAIQFDDDLAKAGKRKPTRRPSGLLATKVAITTVLPTGAASEGLSPRPPSPAFGSPLRREAALEEEDAVLAVASAAEPMDEDEDDDILVRRDKKKSRDKEPDRAADWGRDPQPDRDRESITSDSRRDREKRRMRESDEGPSPLEAKKPKLKDVTNSPPPRPSLANLEIPADRDRQRTPDVDVPMSTTSATTTASFASARSFLTPLATPAPLPRTGHEREFVLPTPRASNSPPPELPAESESQYGGRERRVRKSINYTEPKLNTKMRKPDPVPSSSSKRNSTSSDTAPRRSSLEAPAITPSSSSSGDALATPPQPVAGVKRKKSRAQLPIDEEEESEGAQADAEYGGLSLRAVTASGWVNDARRRGGTSRRLDGDELRRHTMAI